MSTDQIAAINPAHPNFAVPALHRYHDTAPVERDHPTYAYMRDLDGDGVVGCVKCSKSVPTPRVRWNHLVNNPISR